MGEPLYWRPRQRAWVTVLLTLAVLPLVAFAVVRIGGLESGFPAIQLVAFTPYAALVAFVLALLAFWLRRWVDLGLAFLTACVLASVILPRVIPDTDRLAGAKGPHLTVLATNLRVGAAPAATITDLVRRHSITVLTIQELTPAAVTALDEAGLRELMPHRVTVPLEGVGGSGIYSTFPLTPGGPLTQCGFGQARATLQVPDAPAVEVISVHPPAPTESADTRCWTAGLDALPLASKRGDASAPIRILAGDFNATLDHARMRRLLASGYRDAGDVTGHGMLGTWPYNTARANVTPPVILDHVLADLRVGVRGFNTHPVPDTDHRAVRADLVLPS